MEKRNFVTSVRTTDVNMEEDLIKSASDLFSKGSKSSKDKDSFFEKKASLEDEKSDFRN